MTDFPRSLMEFQHRFPDEQACAAYLVAARWPEGFRCPACRHGRGWQLATKPFTWECAGCGRQTSVTAGTVMHGSKLALTVWFWAACLMATHSNGISAVQLQAQLALGSDKTAWLLCACRNGTRSVKLRRAMVNPDRNPLSGLVEIDETAIPLRTRDEPVGGGAGRSPQGKMRVIAAAETVDGQPGRLRLAPIALGSAESIRAFVASNIKAGSTLKSDGWTGYPGTPDVHHEPNVLGKMAAHLVLPWTHRVFANLKRWALGVYHGLRRKHLQSHLDEFVLMLRIPCGQRFNRRRTRLAAFRTRLGIGTKINPVTYKMLISPEAAG